MLQTYKHSACPSLLQEACTNEKDGSLPVGGNA